MARLKDLTGQKFNRLIVLETFRENNITYCKWRCDCGNITLVQKGNLKNGSIKSCGCLAKELSKKRRTTHGLTGTRIFRIWDDMKKRCYNKNEKSYNNYGGRGIIMCNEWKNDFKAFYDWSMAHGYADNLTIDRIDVNSNYEPSNCRWVDKKTQQNNTRRNRYITYNNETHTIAEWVDILNISYNKLYKRIMRGKAICD